MTNTQIIEVVTEAALEALRGNDKQGLTDGPGRSPRRTKRAREARNNVHKAIALYAKQLVKQPLNHSTRGYVLGLITAIMEAEEQRG